MALLHHPVTNKRGEVITSAVTNLDLHDISRAVATYGVKRFYVVTPVSDQLELAEKIVAHWTKGHGAQYNPKRKHALEHIRVMETPDQVLKDIEEETGERPQTVATDARARDGAVGYREFAQMAATGSPFVLLFGTAWGLTDEFLDTADLVLKPICGPEKYNHLSVRSAAAIILDRILGVRNRP